MASLRQGKPNVAKLLPCQLVFWAAGMLVFLHMDEPSQVFYIATVEFALTIIVCFDAINIPLVKVVLL